MRDLVVDPAPFVERWDRVMPAVVGADVAADAMPRPVDSRSGSLGSAADSADCISCGACFAACDMAGAGMAFLGPAALTRAMVTTADRRDVSRARRLALVAGPDGVDGCHGIGACSLVCPRDLDPQRAIRRLRRWRVTGAP